MIIIREKKEKLSEGVHVSLNDVLGEGNFRFIRFNCGDALTDYLPIDKSNKLARIKGDMYDVALLGRSNRKIVCFEERDIESISWTTKSILHIQLINSWVDLQR